MLKGLEEAKCFFQFFWQIIIANFAEACITITEKTKKKIYILSQSIVLSLHSAWRRKSEQLVCVQIRKQNCLLFNLYGIITERLLLKTFCNSSCFCLQDLIFLKQPEWNLTGMITGNTVNVFKKIPLNA